MRASTPLSSSVTRIAAIGLVLLVSGCASTGSIRDNDPKTCALVGGLLGAAAGAVISNPHHGDDDDSDAVAGGAIGAVVGGGLGYLLCGKPAENVSPSVRISATPNSGEAPLAVDLRSTSSDPDGRIVSYAWDLGDGNTATGPNVSHTYQSAGRYRPRLTVTDDRGATMSADTTVTARSKPAPRAAPPAPAPEVTRRIVLRGVNFAFDSSELSGEARVILDAANEALEGTSVSVQVAGHTDATGPDAYNQSLSERRARAVRDYLVSRGIAAGRLNTIGFGESQPVADNGTSDGRAQNRRVELNVMR